MEGRASKLVLLIDVGAEAHQVLRHPGRAVFDGEVQRAITHPCVPATGAGVNVCAKVDEIFHNPGTTPSLNCPVNGREPACFFFAGIV